METILILNENDLGYTGSKTPIAQLTIAHFNVERKFWKNFTEVVYRTSDGRCKVIFPLIKTRATITPAEIKELVTTKGLTLEALCDVLIDVNGLAGYTLLDFVEDFDKYMHRKASL